ncbi:protein-tyrosine-phosphatase [Gilliamella sp. wkB108]|uniref:tyrosine-protein phosphatase n=1 Tax=Gilliamella sp. wkB108 TaxID=3120256 RepID=UPI00080E49F1|nr:tyrosine-protein phosphatase [Gilliamella apicola]OCG24696.1 protein-tyrosine-phosphatase [Gilliamella apicola]
MIEQNKSVSVVRNQQGNLVVTFDSSDQQSMDLYWTEESNAHTQNKTLIGKNVKSPVIFADPLQAKKRIYLILQSQGQHPILFGERTLPITGLNNFRDFGGYEGNNGKRIKWGVFYRSNHLHGLKPDAQSYIQALGIKTIIDYRSDNEIKNSPNTNIGEKQTLHLNASAQTAELAAQFAADPSDEDRALVESVLRDIPRELVNGQGEQVLEQYRNFVLSDKSKNAYKQMLQVILNPNNSPSIQHCRGGKDRTGYGVLLIQIMLGVSESDIIYDYMLTHDNRLERNKIKMQAYRKITDNEDVLGYLLSLIDTRESFVKEILDTMKKLSGTPSNYIKQELGFTDQDFQTMQHLYLEN